MHSMSWRSAGVLLAAAVMLVVLRPVPGIAGVQVAERCFRHQVLLRGCGQWYRCGRGCFRHQVLLRRV